MKLADKTLRIPAVAGFAMVGSNGIRPLQLAAAISDHYGGFAGSTIRQKPDRSVRSKKKL